MWISEMWRKIFILNVYSQVRGTKILVCGGHWYSLVDEEFTVFNWIPVNLIEHINDPRWSRDWERKLIYCCYRYYIVNCCICCYCYLFLVCKAVCYLNHAFLQWPVFRDCTKDMYTSALFLEKLFLNKWKQILHC